MVQQSVVSREYKIMLRRLRFAGDEKKLLDGFRADRALTAVNRFTACEVVIVGGRLQVGSRPIICRSPGSLSFRKGAGG